MNESKELEKALTLLKNWAYELSKCAGKTQEEAEAFWKRLLHDKAVYSEYKYYFNNREFLCELNIDGYTIADLLVWQMDHFRAHLDRSDSENRYDKDKLLYSTFNIFLDMHENPEVVKKVFSEETGIDISSGWYTH